MKKRKKLGLVLIMILIIMIGVGVFLLFSFLENERISEEKLELEKEELIEVISSKNKSLVIVTKDTSIYDESGLVIGKIYKDEVVNLEVLENVDENTKYFKFSDGDYYLSYLDVEEYFEEVIVDTNYKYLIPFNENIVADFVVFYRDGVPFLELEDSFNLPIIRKDDLYYYVEYNDELVSVKKDSVEVVSNINSNEEVASSVPVLNYHFFYDKGEESVCNQVICHRTDLFENDLIYLKDNDYYGATMDQLYQFLNGEVNLPLKSVVFTIDDGWLADKGIILLDKYQFNHTLFAMSEFYTDDNIVDSEYLEIHSHTNDLHVPYSCPGYGLQGSALYCYDYEMIYNDLELSRERLNNSEYFCFPFYEYSDYAIGILKDVGFKMAFIGGNVDAKVGVDLYKVPRHVIWSNTNIKSIVN